MVLFCFVSILSIEIVTLLVTLTGLEKCSLQSRNVDFPYVLETCRALLLRKLPDYEKKCQHKTVSTDYISLLEMRYF